MITINSAPQWLTILFVVFSGLQPSEAGPLGPQPLVVPIHQGVETITVQSRYVSGKPLEHLSLEFPTNKLILHTEATFKIALKYGPNSEVWIDIFDPTLFADDLVNRLIYDNYFSDTALKNEFEFQIDELIAEISSQLPEVPSVNDLNGLIQHLTDFTSGLESVSLTHLRASDAGTNTILDTVEYALSVVAVASRNELDKLLLLESANRSHLDVGEQDEPSGESLPTDEEGEDPNLDARTLIDQKYTDNHTPLDGLESPAPKNGAIVLLGPTTEAARGTHLSKAVFVANEDTTAPTTFTHPEKSAKDTIFEHAPEVLAAATVATVIVVVAPVLSPIVATTLFFYWAMTR